MAEANGGYYRIDQRRRWVEIVATSPENMKGWQPFDFGDCQEGVRREILEKHKPVLIHPRHPLVDDDPD